MRSWQVFLFSATFLLLTLFVVWYISQERYIYFWDYSMYHSLYRELGLRLSHNPFEAVGAIVASVRKNDYNMLPTLFLMPFYFVFGSSRLAYILSITTLFAFPALILFTRVMRALNDRDSHTNEGAEDLFLVVIAVAVIALAPQFWLPVLRGYVDVVGLNIIFLVLMLYFRHDLAEQPSRTLIALGFLVSLLILLRRWYAYWVIGFFCSIAVSALVSTLLDRTPFQLLKRSCKNIAIIGATAVLAFFVIATPIAVTMLTTNYRATLAAYRSSDSVFSHCISLSLYFGVPFVVASIMGLLLMSTKDGRGRMAIFIAVQFAITFLLFTRTQDIDIHHYYWVSVTIFMLTAFFLWEVYAWLKTRLLKLAFVSVLIVACFSNFLSAFYEGVSNFFSPVSSAFSQGRFYPLKRKDLDQVQRLLQTLHTLTRDSDSKIYILASSGALNGSIVRSGVHSFEPALADLERNLLVTNDVDARDGFPFQFFTAQYVVVTYPVGYHLPPEHQRVIGLLAEELIKGEGLGQAYVRLPVTFALEYGSTAYIYKKNAAFKADDLERISDTFVKLYPDFKEKFVIPPAMIHALSSS